MSSYTEYKKRVLQNPEIKAEYDAFEPYSKYSPFEKREEISNTTTFNARTNSDIKQQCAPFDICIEQTNNDTITAMLEAEHIAHAPSTKRYSNVEDALRVLKEWITNIMIKKCTRHIIGCILLFSDYALLLNFFWILLGLFRKHCFIFEKRYTQYWFLLSENVLLEICTDFLELSVWTGQNNLLIYPAHGFLCCPLIQLQSMSFFTSNTFATTLSTVSPQVILPGKSGQEPTTFFKRIRFLFIISLSAP